MKRKIYAISLLLSFLVVLSHEMIKHHHHEPMASGLSIACHSYEADAHHQYDKYHYNHDSEDDENGQKRSDKEHNHSFPFHQHISATSDFVGLITNLLESNLLNRISSLFVVTNVFLTDIFETLNLSQNLFRDKSFLISSNYHPVANALRGPPTIA